MYRTVVTICTAQWLLYVPHSGHNMYRTVVTVCTTQWSLYLPHSGHCMYHQFNIQQFYVLPTQCIYVFCLNLRTQLTPKSAAQNTNPRADIKQNKVTNYSVKLGHN
jgi:hypothetical protein